MITQIELDKVIELRKKGYSTYRIASVIGITRRKVSYHITKHLGKIKIIKKIDLSNVNKNKETLGEFLGIFCADGNYYVSNYTHNIRLYFALDEKDYALNIYNILSKFFNKKPFWLNAPKEFVLKYNSKELKKLLYQYLQWEGKKTYSIKLISTNHPLPFLKGFIRGYFDCDGYTDKGHRQITMFTVSSKMALQLHQILKNLGFDNKMYIKKGRDNRKDVHYVPLYGENASKFIKFIKPKNSKRVPSWL